MAGKIPTATEISKEIEKLKEEISEKFEDEVLKLQDSLVPLTPVDTSHLISSWEDPMKINPFKFRLRNTASYAYQILIVGREAGRGSHRLPDGLLPYIRRWLNK